MTRALRLRAGLAATAALVLGLPLAAQLPWASASTPSAQTLTAATTIGEVRTVSWTGTIPAGANPSSECLVPGTTDAHQLSLVLPAGAPVGSTARVTFEISWTPSSPDAATSDEILQVTGAAGTVGTADGGNPKETVTVDGLAAGTYTAAACGYANALPQPYTGTASVVLVPGTAPAALPTVAGGLEFGATTPSDPQKSQGEPAVTVDRAGTVYTCGTNGASNGTDHASVSVDGGQTFRTLGLPPTGTLGTAQGGGDCALGTGQDKNADGTYTLAYAGLGPLTGFSTATSRDRGRTLDRSPTQNETPVDQMAGVDRQWIAFTDDRTAFLNYNSFPIGGQVVQKSTNGGQTYGPALEVATDGDRLGQIRVVPDGTYGPGTQDVVYFPYNAGNRVKVALSRDGGTTWSQCLVANSAAPPIAGFTAASHDAAGNLYVTWAEKGGGRDTYFSALRASQVAGCAGASADSAQNNTDPGWTTPVRVNREGVETTVMPWIAAGGAPGRVAVAYYGTPTVGDPDLGSTKATWHVYVSQTLDAFAPAVELDQAQATTHPFHYDSICLNGLGCTTSVPEGDRSLVDYFTMELDEVTGRLVIVYSQAAKVPGAATGNLSTPAVLVQRAGPSNLGTTLTAGAKTLRTGSPDPAGDAFPAYTSGTALLGSPDVQLPSPEVPAADLRDVSVDRQVDLATGKTVQDGGFTVTLKVADLSDAALRQAVTSNANRSLVYLFRYVDGYQSSAVAAYYDPIKGFRFGHSGYSRTAVNPGGSVLTYPGSTPVQGKVDKATGTIRISVPRSLLVELAGSQGPDQRPVEQKVRKGSRIYDATGYVLMSPSLDAQQHTYLDPTDMAASFDFKVP